MKNIILITVDCLRADRLKMMPNLQKLAENGMYFEQCISLSRSTPSSFIGMFTSTYPLMYNGKMWMSDPRIPFAKLLQENGYRTIAVHSNPWISSLTGYDKGFDIFDDGLRDKISLLAKIRNYAMTNIPNNASIYNFMANLYSALFGGAYISAEQTNKIAINYTYWAYRPYFLWLHYMDAHEPHLSGDFFQRWNTSKMESKAMRNPESMQWHERRLLENIYNDRVKYIDSKIGELLNHPKTCKLINNTVVIITADHGYQLFEHGHYTHAGNSLWEELIRVPLIIYGADIPKIEIREQVSHIDLAPTILDLAKINKPDCYIGESLLGDNHDMNAFSEADNTVKEGQLRQWSRYPVLDNVFAVVSLRSNNWKYIWRNQGKDELYDLSQGEFNNLIETHTNKADKMSNIIMKHINKERYGAMQSI